MRASHSAEGRLETGVVGVLILVQPLAEDGVHDALANWVDQSAHLEALEHERSALREDFLAVFGCGGGSRNNNLAGLDGAAQSALAGVAELPHTASKHAGRVGQSGAGHNLSYFERTRSPLANFSVAGRWKSDR